MKTLRVLGIMSGTSIDSIDYALCDVNAQTVRLNRYWQVKFPRRLQHRLHQAASNRLSSYGLAQLHHDLGRFYAEHASRGLSAKKPQLIGLHGQTVFHNPEKSNPATLQLGEPAYLVEALRVPVVSNFRAADLASGGQGAPLATYFHKLIFARRGQHVCVNNLGGISNVTSIDWVNRKEPALLSFDTGPANMLIDLAMSHFTAGQKKFDLNGRWTARGKVAEELMRRWLKFRFFLRPPPKSTGRELFGEPFFERALAQMSAVRLSRYDAVATLTEFTARSLALNYRLHLKSIPQLVILTGGGAANANLVNRIRAQLQLLNPAAKVVTVDELGWPLQSIEPAAFAFLAYLRMRRRPGNIPSTTGAKRSALLGQVAEP